MAVNTRLVLIETSGNQSYIFETNKRRENVGASQLVHELGATWLPGALESLGVVAGRAEDDKVEVLVASSGKALVVVPAGALGEDLVAAVTTRALTEAPGLDVCGVVSEPFTWGDQGGLAAASRQVHHQFQDVRSRRPGPQLRALRLPIVAPCATTGLAAALARREAAGEAPIDISAASAAKWDASERGLDRLAHLAGTNRDRLRDVVADLADAADWVAVVHADGNGLGSIFRDFQQALPAPQRSSDRAFADKLCAFSLAVGEVAEQALKSAIGALTPGEVPGVPQPVLPLVAGGDDITVVCDGKVALELTVELLRGFERLSAASGPVVDALATLGTPVTRLGACAGAVFVKPHYPFAAAYDMCEDLTAHAKREVKRAATDARGDRVACSALDFHVVYDSGATSLHQVREQLTRAEDGGTTTLFAKPYVVTPLEDLASANPDGLGWAERHSWDLLCQRASLLVAEDNADGDPRRRLPSSQAHALRSAAHAGTGVSEVLFARLLARYPSAGLSRLGGEGGKLYWQDPAGGSASGAPPERRTALLDAMEASAFLPVAALGKYTREGQA